jgi:hypothetical protein
LNVPRRVVADLPERNSVLFGHDRHGEESTTSGAVRSQPLQSFATVFGEDDLEPTAGENVGEALANPCVVVNHQHTPVRRDARQWALS